MGSHVRIHCWCYVWNHDSNDSLKSCLHGFDTMVEISDDVMFDIMFDMICEIAFEFMSEIAFGSHFEITIALHY